VARDAEHEKHSGRQRNESTMKAQRHAARIAARCRLRKHEVVTYLGTCP
jgi:hypothetical protein